MPSGPPQAWVNADAPHGREQVDEHLVQLGEDVGVAVVLGSDPRAEVVRRAAAAERQPAVRGALPVDDEVPVVAERLALAPVRPGPTRRRAAARSRPSASRPVRRSRRIPGSSACSPRSRGPRRRPAPGRAAVTTPAGLDRGDRCPLVAPSRRAARPREPARGPAAPGGSTRSAACRSRRAPRPRCRCDVASSAPSSARSSSPKPHRRASATSARARSSCTGVRAATTVPPLLKWQSMPSASATRPDLVDGTLHRAVLRDRPVVAVPLRQPADRGGEQRRAPAAVAAARAEARHLPLEHRDPQRRVGDCEVVRGPESGVPRADDRDVDVEVTRQRTSRREVVVGGVVPERQRAVRRQRLRHRRDQSRT